MAARFHRCSHVVEISELKVCLCVSLSLCLCLYRVGYHIPMFAGFIIMFVSTISELDTHTHKHTHTHTMVIVFFHVKNSDLTCVRVCVCVCVCVCQCLRSQGPMHCCSLLALCKESVHPSPLWQVDASILKNLGHTHAHTHTRTHTYTILLLKIQ